MRTVFVIFDSLNRSAIGAYGGTSVATPNFDRFAARSRVFDTHYVGSLPCMPARRDMHTGRLNFTHRSWGPLEPFDNSFARILKDNQVHTHLISDHFHYFEDGGAGFHTRFSTWEFIRGQEHDPWVAMAQPPIDRFRQEYSEQHYNFDNPDKRLQNAINRELIKDEQEFPGPKSFAAGFEFLDRNRDADDWLLMLECFDPHEPFHAPDRFQKAYNANSLSKILDWPHYERVTESESEMQEIRANYAALVAMCDEYFGKLLDYFDAHKMWEDTALILTTDHGFLLSEHGWWGKMRMPYYEEISHIPLMFHDPRNPHFQGMRTSELTQTADLMPTLLGLHNIAPPEEVIAHNLASIPGSKFHSYRKVAVFGLFGGPLAITDGRYSLFHYPPDLYAEGLREYTLAPSHMSDFFTLDELRSSTLSPGFDFTKGVPLLSIAALPNAKRVPANDGLRFDDLGTRLFDLHIDPKQETPIEDHETMSRLLTSAIQVLESHDTPDELFRWYGLDKFRKINKEENNEISE